MTGKINPETTSHRYFLFWHTDFIVDLGRLRGVEPRTFSFGAWMRTSSASRENSILQKRGEDLRNGTPARASAREGDALRANPECFGCAAEGRENRDSRRSSDGLRRSKRLSSRWKYHPRQVCQAGALVFCREGNTRCVSPTRTRNGTGGRCLPNTARRHT